MLALNSLPAWGRNLLLLLLGGAEFALLWPERLALRQSQVDLFLGLAAAQTILCLLAARIIWKTPPARSTWLIVLALAGLFRLGLLFEPPRLSDDIYRYLWDGRVQAAGINPYRYIPAAPELAPLRDEKIYPFINRRTYAPTIYPPVAQVIFRVVHQVTESVVGFKASLLLFEAITMVAMMRLLASFGLPRARVLVYAWNPLVLWEFSGSGHIDAAMIAFVALALVARRAERPTLTGVLLGAAVLTKFFPLILFAALYRRWDWKMPCALVVTLLAGYLPYLSAGSRVLGFLSAYADEEGMRSGRYFLLQIVSFVSGGAEIPAAYYLGPVALLLGALALRAVWRRNARSGGFLFSAGLLGFAFTFFLSPRFAWYWSWTIPFLAFVPWPAMTPLFVFTAAALVHYGKWFDDGRWWFGAIHPHLALSGLQLLPAALVLCLIARWRPESLRRTISALRSLL